MEMNKNKSDLVVELYEQGKTYSEIVTEANVSMNFVVETMDLYHEFNDMMGGK